MTPEHPLPDDGAHLARELAEVWKETALPGTLTRGADLLARRSGARGSALFLITDEGIAAEGWSAGHPADMEQRLRFQRAVLLGTTPDSAKPAAPAPFVLRCALSSPAGGDASGGTLVWAHDGCGAADECRAVVELLAVRVGILGEVGRHRARQEQYERWFKTLDGQLRILDRERQKFAAVANQSDTYAFVTDRSRTIRWHNKAMAQLLGDADAAWTGRPCEELCNRLGLKGAAVPCDACPVMSAHDSNAAVHQEVTDAPGGRELYLTALPIKGPDGRALEVLGQVQDLTNLEVVRRAKERLETVIAGAPIILFSVDPDGIVTLSEGKGLEALGRTPGQSVGQSVYELYRDVPEACECIRRALAGETQTQVVDVGPLSFETYYGPLRGVDGAIHGMIGVATNITERRQAERALQESEEKLRHAQRLEAVGSLAGGIAHDFNNLLTAMFGHLKFLRERVGNDAKSQREVDAVERAADRAATLTRQLLAFSRKQVQQLRVVDLNAILREMEPMLRRLIREDIELMVRPAALHPWIQADMTQVEQVVVNLVVNARDAMPQGGRLELETLDLDESGPLSGNTPGSWASPEQTEGHELAPGAYVGLRVRDTGVGMDAATQARAFEPFFTTKPVGEGTGLGLATVYGIVKQSHGEVFLTSAPNAGATFSIYFPRTGPPSGPEPQAFVRPALVPGQETILLVEDEAMVRELFRDVLLAAGYHVLEARNGMEALEIAAKHHDPIDLMVTDVVMPGMSGGELVRRMGESRPEVKVLYVSGYNDDVLVRRGVIESGVSFLQKPCMPDELSRVVRSILG